MKVEYLGPLEEPEFLGPAFISGKSLEGIHPDVSTQFQNMAKEFYEKTGEPLKVWSGYRTTEHQARLYNKDPSSGMIAPPGRSYHEKGLAIDLDKTQVPKIEKLGLLDTYGFTRPVLHKGETWHIEPTWARAEKKMEATAGSLPKVEYLGPVEAPEYLGPTTTSPEELALAAGIKPEAGLETPTFLDPINMLSGVAGIGKAATTGVLGALTKPGLTAIAKATPGVLASEAAGGAAYSALEGDKTVPEWAKLPLAMTAGVGGGLLSSKLGQIPRGAKLALQGGKNPLPPQEALIAELTTGLNKGQTAQEALQELATKYGRSVSELASVSSGAGKAALGVSAVTKVTNPWDSSDLGAPIVTKSFKTSIDSTLGPTGTVVETMPLHEGHVVMREAFNGKDIKAPTLMSWKNTLKTNERIFSELDDIAPGFQDEFWGKLKWSENIAHNNTKGVFSEVDALQKQVGKKTGDKIGIDLISQRPTGKERLEKMGLKTQPLTVEERQIANDFKIKFQTYLERINDARALAGKEPIPTDPNYVTFMVNFIDKVNQGVNPVVASARSFIVPSTTPFKFAKPMGSTKELVSTNIFDIYKNYAALAERHINISPHLEKIRKFVGGMELPNGTAVPELRKVAPNAAAALTNMSQVISGVKNPMSRGERLLSQLSDNLVISTLGAYPRSVVNQTGALATAVAETGVPNLIKGITKMLVPGAGKEAVTASNVLGQRKMDVVLEDLGANFIKSGLSKAKHGAMLPLEFVDDFIAKASWWAGMFEGKANGLNEEAARKFADKIVIRTQASASPIDRAMIQSSTLGKIATAFQTFTIADANYIARNIFGKGNLNFKTVDGFKKLANMTGVGVVLNLLQREVLGMPPGLPEPIAKGAKALEEGAGPVETAWEASKEFAPYIPIVGSMAYGRVPFGAVGGAVGDLVSGYKSPTEVLTMLAGVPGMGIAQRALKTQEGRELLSDLEQETGLPIGPRAKPKSITTWEEVAFGKEPEAKRRKEWRSDEFLKGFIK